jgi:GntR family transcriptional regulator
VSGEKQTAVEPKNTTRTARTGGVLGANNAPSAGTVDKTRGGVPIAIDNNSGIPLWLQLRNRLIYLITSGHFRRGDKLPTVRNLAVELGINFNTVAKVYRDIERDGYIVSRQGAGTFVSDEYTRREGAVLVETDLLIDEFIRECLELGVPRDDIVGLVIERLMETDEDGEKEVAR